MAKKYIYANKNLSNIKVALDDYYNLNVTYYVNTTADLIFSCPAICDKELRFYLLNASTICCQIGTWDGSIFTSIIDFAGTMGNSTYATNGYGIVALDNCFIVIATEINTYNNKFIIIAKTTANKYIISSLNQSNYAANISTYKTMYTDLTDLKFKGLTDIFQSADGRLFASKLLIETKATGLINTVDDTFETINGLSTSSKRTASKTLTIGGTYALLPSGYFDGSAVAFPNSILVEGITN